MGGVGIVFKLVQLNHIFNKLSVLNRTKSTSCPISHSLVRWEKHDESEAHGAVKF